MAQNRFQGDVIIVLFGVPCVAYGVLVQHRGGRQAAQSCLLHLLHLQRALNAVQTVPQGVPGCVHVIADLTLDVQQGVGIATGKRAACHLCKVLRGVRRVDKADGREARGEHQRNDVNQQKEVALFDPVKRGFCKLNHT